MRPVSVGEDGGGEARCAMQGATAAMRVTMRGVLSCAEVWSTMAVCPVEANTPRLHPAKADVGTFSMAAATHSVAVAAGALACSLGPSWRGRAAALAGLLEGTAVLSL